MAEFEVRADAAVLYDEPQVDAQIHKELSVPAEDLDGSNATIVAQIRVVAGYRHGELVT